MTFVSYFVDGRIRRGWLRWRQSSGSILQRLCRWQSPAGICRADPHPTAIRDGKNKRTWINFILFKVFPIFIRRSSVVIDFLRISFWNWNSLRVSGGEFGNSSRFLRDDTQLSNRHFQKSDLQFFLDSSSISWASINILNDFLGWNHLKILSRLFPKRRNDERDHRRSELGCYHRRRNGIPHRLDRRWRDACLCRQWCRWRRSRRRLRWWRFEQI